MSVILKTQPKNKTDYGGETMVTSRTEHLHSIKVGFLDVGKILARILSILLMVYLAFFIYLAVHEWMGHILCDAFVFARHETTIETLDVVVQFVNVKMEAGRWSVGLAPFRIGAEVITAYPSEMITLSDWEDGFSLLWGSGITTLLSLVFLLALNLRKNMQRFPWFLSAFALSSVIFDQFLYTFGNPPDALIGAVQMGINSIFFKGLVIFLVIIQFWLLVRLVIRYRRGKQARSVGSK
jgi:hypothetical protein